MHSRYRTESAAPNRFISRSEHFETVRTLAIQFHAGPPSQGASAGPPNEGAGHLGGWDSSRLGSRRGPPLRSFHFFWGFFFKKYSKKRGGVASSFSAGAAPAPAPPNEGAGSPRGWGLIGGWKHRGWGILKTLGDWKHRGWGILKTQTTNNLRTEDFPFQLRREREQGVEVNDLNPLFSFSRLRPLFLSLS